MSKQKDSSSWLSEKLPAEFVEIESPQIEVEEVPLCPVCENTKSEQFAVGFDYESQTCKNPWRFVQCDTCSHVWLNPRPALSELSTIYPPTYYAYDFEGKVNSIALKGKAFLDNLKMGGIFKQLSVPMTSFLDIGCGSGRFLRVAKERGVDPQEIYGLELDDRVVTRLKKEGFNVFCERVEEAQGIPSDGIDLATMFHVIEHVDDPYAVIEKIGGWLSPGGILALETPNLDSVDARLFKKSFWGGYHIPRHWNIFTPDSMRRLLERAGLEVVSISYQPGQSFWMWSLHHKLRFGKLESKRFGDWFHPLVGLPFLIGFTGFDKLRAFLGFKTSAMLIVAKKPQ